MKLNTILENCNSPIDIINCKNFTIKGICTHSKKVKNNYIFAAIKGKNLNGEKFISELLKYRNIVIIYSKSSKLKIEHNKFKNVVFIQAEDVRFFFSEICLFFFPNRISQKLAITGTNGKTSISFYILQIWNKQNINGASIGTLGINYRKDIKLKSNLTTPDVIYNHKVLNELTKSKCTKVIFEASSIGLDQRRLSPIKFDVIGFSNLSIDHLDYHKSINSYKLAKSLLFTHHSKEDSYAVINTDSKFSDFFIDLCKKKKLRILDYGKKANFLKIKKIERIKNFFEVKILFKSRIITLKIDCCSEFEVYNMLCSLIMVFTTKLETKNFKIISELRNPSGRLEKIFDKKGMRVFVDYAHTPDAISEILKSLKKITENKLILVFGCGGDRDKSKRSLMTREAIKYSDIIIITDDNPRFEEAASIRKDMIKNIKAKDLKKIIMIENRKEAIKSAVNLLLKNDTLVIAGKGHENYQLIRDKKLKFSDKEIAKEYLKQK